ncbi:unnamed protein product [Soboliphyme baturini]|uniref:Uncharacterized protein n=1 Tax=Soboliphyme baturini TaxID=241478 RepID=A0A183J289_9BILA|nr:unnamed protein product [Soboliphyme baturini]
MNGMRWMIRRFTSYPVTFTRELVDVGPQRPPQQKIARSAAEVVSDTGSNPSFRARSTEQMRAEAVVCLAGCRVVSPSVVRSPSPAVSTNKGVMTNGYKSIIDNKYVNCSTDEDKHHFKWLLQSHQQAQRCQRMVGKLAGEEKLGSEESNKDKKNGRSCAMASVAKRSQNGSATGFRLHFSFARVSEHLNRRPVIIINSLCVRHNLIMATFADGSVINL